MTANLRFVISYVKKYQGHGLDLSELVAIGNEGLLKAVRKFDPDQGVKFISYAVWWVRQAVLKALAEQTRTVRIPLNQNSQLIRMARGEMILSQVLNREPTDEELSKLLEEPVEQVRNARQITSTEVSLDAPIDRQDREASTLGERFAGETHADIEDGTDFRLMREFIDRVFRKYLTPRERKILYLYYGLDEGAEAMTLERIGALMGVTRNASGRSANGPSRSCVNRPTDVRSPDSGAPPEVVVQTVSKAISTEHAQHTISPSPSRADPISELINDTSALSQFTEEGYVGNGGTR